MYKLTLTLGERKAIDFCGVAYRHGHELYTLLCRGEWAVEDGELSADWDCTNALTISISESVAWEIRDLIEEAGSDLACFSESFRDKLYNFADSII